MCATAALAWAVTGATRSIDARNITSRDVPGGVYDDYLLRWYAPSGSYIVNFQCYSYVPHQPPQSEAPNEIVQVWPGIENAQGGGNVVFQNVMIANANDWYHSTWYYATA